MIFIGLALVAIGLLHGGWMIAAVWPGLDFLALGIAHAAGAHGLFGKRPDGSLPVWSWVVFLPLLLFSMVVWYVLRVASREPPLNAVTERLAVGRRLLTRELNQRFDNYVDLTAEFSEPASIRCSPAYCSFPILDGAAPSPEALDRAVERLRPGKTFIHCAQGHGRTALFAIAVLLKSGEARDIPDALRRLKAVRPGIKLNGVQRGCIEVFAQKFTPAEQSRGKAKT